jgi:hypothetical protein
MELEGIWGQGITLEELGRYSLSRDAAILVNHWMFPRLLKSSLTLTEIVKKLRVSLSKGASYQEVLLVLNKHKAHIYQDECTNRWNPARLYYNAKMLNYADSSKVRQHFSIGTQSVKVSELRKIYGQDIILEIWLSNPKNLYIGRRGRVNVGNGRIFTYSDSKWANPFTVKQHGLSNALAL